MITHERASAIAHGDLRHHHPMSEAAIETVLSLPVLGERDRVLDVGCGRGELLVRIAERTGASGRGIDVAAEQIAVARAEAEARVPGAMLRFDALDAAELDEPAGSLALAVCVGSTHALGGLQGTLARLTPFVRPGGHLLVGEGFWASRPSAAFLEALGGATEDELTGYAELLTAGAPHGLEPVYAATASRQDWERYEWANIFHAERYVRQHPEEEGVELLRDRVDAARRRRVLCAADGEPLGFALVLWRR